MEYKIIWATGILDLEGAVNKRIGEGWEVQGGVHSIFERSSDFVISTNIEFYQAMVKKNE